MDLQHTISFLGRFHPLVVHLPIGFLFLAVMAQGFSHLPGYRHLEKLVPFALLAGFIAATLACVLGFMLSFEGEYDSRLLSGHRFAGISLTLISGALYFLSTNQGKKYIRVPRNYFTFCMAALFILLGYTGHQGGSLTHGSDYLSLQTLMQENRPLPQSVEEAFIFEDVVHPILRNKCLQCHGKGKIKGELSIRTYKDLIRGGESGPALLAGNLSKSELYRRITLEPDHEEFMPGDGKTPLTKVETEIIRWWIEKGMITEGKKMTELEGMEEIRLQVASVLGFGGPLSGEDSTGGIARTINPEIPPTLDMKLVENLRDKGLVVRVMFREPVMLDITLPAGSGKNISEIAEALQALSGHVIWLNLSGNGFTEKDLGFLGSLSNIEKLRLEKNPLSDGIVDHLRELKHLEALNLNETMITSSGLEDLHKIPALKRIYTWKTPAEEKNFIPE